MKWGERALWLVAMLTLVVIMVKSDTPGGGEPRWGEVIDVTDFPTGTQMCVKGNIQSRCFTVFRDEDADGCYRGARWERDHCRPARPVEPDAIPASR